MQDLHVLMKSLLEKTMNVHIPCMLIATPVNAQFVVVLKNKWLNFT